MTFTANNPGTTGLTGEEANTLCNTAEREQLRIGDNWYIVKHDWWMQFMELKDRVGREGRVKIGPIDNSTLCIKTDNGYELKPQLVESLDFVLVPEKVFVTLKNCYGVGSEERDVIIRKVVNDVLFNQGAIIEIYPFVMKVAHYQNPSNVVTLTISKGEIIERIVARAMEALNIPAEEADNIRFLIDENGKYAELLPSKIDNESIYQLLTSNLVIYLDFDSRTSESSLTMTTRRTTTAASNESSISRLRGLCGLQNMGNTCFMNSALQCLSNVPELTQYFLSNEYLKEINERNPLGSQGRLARAYGYLIKEMWSGSVPSVKPTKLKAVIGEIAPRFNGYSQQDSQELTSFLLDGLHEDLNRIREKPYILENEDDSIPHEQRAQRAWDDYKKRNDSIIVDLLHGQLRSTVVCPVCSKVSVKFDPFCFLSVPVPAKERQTVSMITLIRSEKWAKFAITHSNKATAAQATAAIKANLQLPESTRIILCSSFAPEIIPPDTPLSSPYATMSNSKNFYAHIVDEGPVVIVENKVSSQDRLLGVPLVLNLPGDGKQISRKAILDHLLPSVRDRLWKKKNIQKNVDVEMKENDENMSPEGDPEDVNVPSDVIFYCDKKYIALPHDAEESIPFPEDNAGDFKICMRWKTTEMFQPVDLNRLVEREINMTAAIKKCYSLDECLDMFTSEEQLDENDSWYCPRCKEHQRAYKKLDLWRLPKILIVHLKRFQYSRYNREKIETDIIVPTRNFDLSKKLLRLNEKPPKYDLIAISNHMGGLGSGHYTALALNGDCWVEFNDSSAAPTRNTRSSMTDSMSTREGYILYYRRQDCFNDPPSSAKKTGVDVRTPPSSATKNSASKKVMNGNFGSPTTRSVARNLNNSFNSNEGNSSNSDEVNENIAPNNKDSCVKRRLSESMKMETDD